MSFVKYRLKEVATDFGTTPKEIADIIAKYGERPKSNTQVLTDEELNIVFDHMTKNRQVSDLQHLLKFGRHVVVLQCHEERVKHDAHGDGEVSKWVHDHELHFLLNGHPQRAALPDQVVLGETNPARWTPALRLLQLWGQGVGRASELACFC